MKTHNIIIKVKQIDENLAEVSVRRGKTLCTFEYIVKDGEAPRLYEESVRHFISIALEEIFYKN